MEISLLDNFGTCRTYFSVRVREMKTSPIPATVTLVPFGTINFNYSGVDYMF